MLGSRFIFISALVFGLLIGAAYLMRWDIAFSSDFVLVGLGAKNILNYGDHPIYIWNLGYQGFLIETHLAALFFLIFGVTPYSLFLTGFVFFVGLLFVFYWSNAQFFSKNVAALSTLFLVISIPMFYQLSTRTVPNYIESYLLGMGIFGVYAIILRRFVLEGRFDRKLIFSLGVLVGLGAYLQEQVYYFVLALIPHLFIFLLKFIRENTGLEFRQILFPIERIEGKFFQKAFYFVNFVFFLGIFWGVFEFFTDSKSSLHGQLGPLRSVLIFSILLVLLHFLVWCFSSTVLRKMTKGLLPYLFGFVLGNSPKLVHVYLLDGYIRNNITINGTFSDFVNKLGIAFQSFQSAYSFSGVLGFFVGLLFTFFALFYIFRVFRLIGLFLRVKGNTEKILEISPMVFLPFVVLVGFCVSARVVDIFSSRYLAVMVLFFATALADSFYWFWRHYRTPSVRAALVGSALAVLGWNGYYLGIDLVRPEQAGMYLELEAALKKAEVRAGYTNYWGAYAVSFLTDEKIILEPTRGGFVPRYGDIVKNADKIAVAYMKNFQTGEDRAFLKNLERSGEYKKLQEFETENFVVAVFKK